ncbi:rod shape-determining protein MreD [Paenibacillus cellulosilyticus]|uniref:Rod shape-determining protein MreD n=1 Tax=Paenibacillus cellulosilyticus TaxID=375489 RepID=A0A2V2YJL9_9BACL|nr:rod shape-determining protein MreD [Paenibacillus cellulosilyticus]PWV91958.1 rod shape-determining protein MreD [Paenibacillus cellulosilyticus]QKS46683.1 rod shape-determining protein MreD [Paenibacillus cellulosilyticus]
MTIGRLGVVMFLLFVIESTLVPWLIPTSLVGRLYPHFTFVFVLYTALYGTRHKALMLGLLFGLMQDVVFYGNLLGLHSFAMGLIGYVTGLLLEKKKSTMMSALFTIAVCCMVYEIIIFAVYRVFWFTRESLGYAMVDHMLLSTFLQLGFALAVYVPARRWVQSAIPVRQPEKEEE